MRRDLAYRRVIAHQAEGLGAGGWAAAEVPARPELTLPAAEADCLRAEYQRAGCILEYGSGGSTVLGAEMAGKTLISVESDRAWHGAMTRYFAAHPPRAKLVLHHADIGPTGDWGHPKSEAQFRRWPGYPLSVLDRPDFTQPDLVLIDGRFRAACFLACLFRTRAPLRVLWDDYAGRDRYHEVETFCVPTRMVGRMAVFDLDPTALPVDRLQQILSVFLRPL
ncbi:MAG: hypothetical protein R3D78_02760 [Paracoccaceae bacterium]